MQTVGDVVREHAARTPEKTAMVFQGRHTTYQKLDQRSNQIANRLLQTDFEREGRIAYLGKNTDRYYEIFFGAAKAGRVLLTVNWRLAESEFAFILDDSQTELLFVEKQLLSVARKLLQRCSSLKNIIVISEDGGEAATADAQYYVQWLSEASNADPGIDIDPDTACVQMYTSGTTGRPKGAVLRHDCFFAQRRAEQSVGQWANWGEDTVNLVAMPVFHIGGSGWGFITFFYGGTNIIHAEPQAETIGRDIARYGITKMFLVPTVLQGVVDFVRQQSLNVASVEDIVYGASPISERLLKEAVQLFGCRFIQQYGMTETTGAVTYLPPEDHDVNGTPRMFSCGIPFPGVEIKICNPQGEAIPSGEVGEICIKTPAIMTHYWNRPEATQETLVDGWYYSGDAGYLDADGYLFMSDRIKDMIVSGGENIYPAEIEKVLYQHPAVQDAAVIGVPDDKWGEAAKAVLVPRHGANLDEVELKAFLRRELAGYKIPKSIDIVASLPRNASGKVLKTELREPYWRGCQRRVN